MALNSVKSVDQMNAMQWVDSVSGPWIICLIATESPLHLPGGCDFIARKEGVDDAFGLGVIHAEEKIFLRNMRS